MKVRISVIFSLVNITTYSRRISPEGNEGTTIVKEDRGIGRSLQEVISEQTETRKHEYRKHEHIKLTYPERVPLGFR